MRKEFVSYEATGKFSRIVLDYLNADNKLEPYYRVSPDLDGCIKIAAERQFSAESRQVLTEVLTGQYDGLAKSEMLEKNLSALEDSNTFTVTTGHQLNLFTGPLFFIYKIAGCINLANQLNKADAGKHYVPIYWMASEDHDFEEINHTWVRGNRLAWDNKSGGPVGEMSPAHVEPVIKELEGILGDRDEAKALVDLFRKSYSQSSLAAAIRFLVNELFGSHGVVVLDANDARLKRLAENVFRDELSTQSAHRIISETNKGLGENYEVAINPRDLNLFVISENSRKRLTVDGGEIQEVDGDTSYPPDAVDQLLGDDIGKLSPNVVLRPVYQECILPNVAYIGGGAEVGYWLQLKELFAHHGVSYPALFLRNSVKLLGAGDVKKMSKLDLSAQDLFHSLDELKKKFVLSHGENIGLEDSYAKQESLFEQIAEVAVGIDPTMKGKVDAEKTRSLKGLKDLENALIKAEKRKQSTSMEQLERLYNRVWPDSVLQERHDNFSAWYLEAGPSFLDELIEHLDPCDRRFAIISLG